MASGRSTKHPRQESLFTKAGAVRKRRPRTFARGKRPGRPSKAGARLRHQRRQVVTAREPVHVTWRMRAGLPNLRSPEVMAAIRLAFVRGKARFGFRLVHFSVQSNHVHMLCEAHGEKSLSRGLQGLAVRVVRGVNRALGRSGKMLDDRYHARVLRSPSETRWALGYVLCNVRRHNAQLLTPRSYPRKWLDTCSSARHFPGWVAGGRPVVFTVPDATSCVVKPQSWFLREGWLKLGRLPTDHLPGPRAPVSGTNSNGRAR